MVLDTYIVVLYLVHFDEQIPIRYLVEGVDTKQAVRNALFACIGMPEEKDDPDIKYYRDVVEKEVLDDLMGGECVYTHSRRIQLGNITKIDPKDLPILKQYF